MNRPPTYWQWRTVQTRPFVVNETLFAHLMERINRATRSNVRRCIKQPKP